MTAIMIRLPPELPIYLTTDPTITRHSKGHSPYSLKIASFWGCVDGADTLISNLFARLDAKWQRGGPSVACIFRLWDRGFMSLRCLYVLEGRIGTLSNNYAHLVAPTLPWTVIMGWYFREICLKILMNKYTGYC